MASTGTLAIMLIVGLLVGIGVTYAAISSSSSSGKTTLTTTVAGSGSTVTVGGSGSTVTVGGSTVTAAGATQTVGGSTVTLTTSVGSSSSGPKVYYIGNINDITGPLASYGA